jgi:hypothetical protein
MRERLKKVSYENVTDFEVNRTFAFVALHIPTVAIVLGKLALQELLHK